MLCFETYHQTVYPVARQKIILINSVTKFRWGPYLKHKQAMREVATICPTSHVTLTFWPWKWCQSRVTCATSVLILVFLCLSVLDLGPMYATDRRQTSDAHHRLMPPRRGNDKKYEKFGIFPSGTAKSHPSYFLNNPVSNQNERIAKLSTSADRCSYTTLWNATRVNLLWSTVL